VEVGGPEKKMGKTKGRLDLNRCQDLVGPRTLVGKTRQPGQKVRPVSVEGVMDTGTKFATSAFQHDDTVTLNAQGHGHSFIDRIQHLTSHKVLGNCDDLGSSHLTSLI
jgi:hypothetical protein